MELLKSTVITQMPHYLSQSHKWCGILQNFSALATQTLYDAKTTLDL